MIRVVEAISDTNIGGAGILLLNRLKYTDKSRFFTTVILPEGSALEKRFSDIGIEVKTVRGAADRSFAPKSFFQYFNTIKEISPDILNSHASLNSRIAGTLCKVPVRIYTRHCVYPVNKIYNSAFVRGVFRMITNVLNHRVIAVAHSAKQNLMDMGVDGKKISVVINGAEALHKINYSEKEKLKQQLGFDGKVVVSICARLEACKGHDCFLRSAAEICKISDKYRFLIIGGGSRAQNLKMLCHKLGLDKKVVFTGFIDDIAPYMNITDINVNCSTGTETSSLALSEGMSLGIPAVVSDYGGNPYMVQHGVNGYVYKMGNYRELADYIFEVTENHKKLSEESLKRYRHELNALRMARQTQTLYLKMYKKSK